jgi:hypothetical protein
MKKFLLLFIAAFICLLGFSNVAYAYYDDTHYSFNYYLARTCGYTPEQAQRIASACVDIDRSRLTEPNQYYNVAVGTDQSAQRPRILFHAFMDSIKYPNCLSSEAEANSAKNDIIAQRNILWNNAFQIKNPGVFLHFLQDETSHEGYSSFAGHWASPSAYWNAPLPLGAYCDFLSSYTKERHQAMVLATVSRLKQFMRRACPAQFKNIRTINWNNEIWPVLEKLIAANPTSRSIADLPYRITEQPSTEKANAILATVLNSQREIKPFPSDPYNYIFDSAGNVGYGLTDNFVLYGQLKLSVNPGSDKSPVTIVIKQAPTRQGENALAIANRAITVFNEPATFNNLPVGNLLIEAYRRQSPCGKTEINLDQESKDVYLKLDEANLQLVLADVSPNKGTSADDYTFRLQYQINGMSETDKIKVSERVVISGPVKQVVSNEEVEIAGTKPLMKKFWKFRKFPAGNYEYSYVIRAKDMSLANSIAFVVTNKTIEPPQLTSQTSPESGVYKCSAPTVTISNDLASQAKYKKAVASGNKVSIYTKSIGSNSWGSTVIAFTPPPATIHLGDAVKLKLTVTQRDPSPYRDEYCSIGTNLTTRQENASFGTKDKSEQELVFKVDRVDKSQPYIDFFIGGLTIKYTYQWQQ